MTKEQATDVVLIVGDCQGVLVRGRRHETFILTVYHCLQPTAWTDTTVWIGYKVGPDIEGQQYSLQCVAADSRLDYAIFSSDPIEWVHDSRWKVPRILDYDTKDFRHADPYLAYYKGVSPGGEAGGPVYQLKAHNLLPWEYLVSKWKGIFDSPGAGVAALSGASGAPLLTRQGNIYGIVQSWLQADDETVGLLGVFASHVRNHALEHFDLILR